jgi:hypothetical protein
VFHRNLPAYLAGGSEEEFERAFRPAVDVHLAARPPQSPWGWKTPRSLYLLPFLDRRLPGLRFLHVVRDGRDMAFSSNQLQLTAFGGILLGPEHDGLGAPERSIALWSRANCAAADFGERELGPRYARVRFEDLCRDPVGEAEAILRFFGLDPSVAAVAHTEVESPASIGRWREHPELHASLARHGAEGLARFGYA